MPKNTAEMETSSSNSRNRLLLLSIALGTVDVHFPPAFLADFVIHFRSMSYYVHKYVLCHHSAYFTTYCQELTAGERAYSADECSGHAHIAHCIRLPDSCGKVGASVEDFRLFLFQLYFAQQLRCIPLIADVEVDLLAQTPPVVTVDVESPSPCIIRRLVAAVDGVDDSFSLAITCEPVLSLCHYFDCATVLSRAEDNCVSVVAADERNCQECDIEESRWTDVWACFLLALKFDLRRVKRACMPLLATYCVRFSACEEEWRKARPLLDVDTVLEMPQATFEVASADCRWQCFRKR